MTTNAKLDEAISAVATAVEATLEKYLPASAETEGQLVEAMRYAMFAGGKRLRPFLVMLTANLFGVPKERSLRVAAAVECIHCYSLIHDDLPAMDDDDMRRGKPTLHKAFDEATAVLAGDALQAMAFEILSDDKTHPEPNTRLELVRTLAHASGMHGMVGGQMIDLTAEHAELEVGEITRLQQLKTGALIEWSAMAGATLGRASEHQRHLLLTYARDVGLAFQIADDLLDHEGAANDVGKATGKDAERGKATFVSLMGAERARKQASILVDQAMGAVDEFGDKALLLKALAQYMVERDH